MDNEVEVKAILAVHLFAPLIPDLPDTDQYGIDNQHFPKDEQQRKCPSCGQKLRFTDTSFGEFWYASWLSYLKIISQLVLGILMSTDSSNIFEY